MTYIEKTDIYSTLTTYLYCAYWQAWAAEQTGRTPYINWPKGKSLIDLKDDAKFSEFPNMYEWYFVQYAPWERTETWTWEQWQDPTPVALMAQPLDVIKEYYQRKLVFNSLVELVNHKGLLVSLQ